MEIFYIAFLTLFASMVGTTSGFGTSTIMIPVLVMFFPPLEAILLVAIIHWFVNLWKVILFHKGFNLKLVALFGIAGLIASYIGASFSLEANSKILLRFLGVFLVSYAVFLLFQAKFKVKSTNKAAIAGGALSGFFAGLFGIGGAIRSMFLSVFDLPKAVYIATAGAIDLIVDLTRISAYFSGGAGLPDGLWRGLLVFIPVSFLGSRLAKSFVNKIPQDQFRKIIAVFLSLAGLRLILFP